MYTVPIIAPDLRHEETIIQAACALDCLRQTIDNVFQNLNSRISTNSRRVEQLGQRIQTAEERIKNFAGVKKALQLYAPTRFPATHVVNEPIRTLSAHKIQHNANVNYDVKSRVEFGVTESMRDKLVYFHVRDSTTSKLPAGGVHPTSIQAKRLEISRKGHILGEAPTDLRSTVSLLQFNSETLIYSETGGVMPVQENWRRLKQNKVAEGVMRKQLLEPAPHSISHRNKRVNPAGELRYMPKMHDAPTMDLPMDLPTLEGVAQDIHFMGIQPNVEELPVIISPTEKSQTNNLPETIKQSSSRETVVHEIIEQSETSPLAIVAVTPAVPPPPPPPPPLQKSTANATNKDTNPKGTKPLVENDTRSALMDAIRRAGGAQGGRLRSAAAAPVDMVDNKSVTAKHEGKAGSNLMVDLHNKLLLRRKGISGVNQDAAVKKVSMGNPVIQRLSALIPPPPPPERQQYEQQHSDDDTQLNNDDDDWE